MPETLVVNFFAGPGAGKTTYAWEVAAELKKRNIVTEYVPEYAKELVWDDRRDMLDGSYAKQRLVLEEQARRVDRLIGKVDVVVTDSPVLLQPAYCKENQAEFEQQALEIFSSRNNFNLFINRGSHYEQAGRIHTLDESRRVDGEVKEILNRHNVYYGTYSHNTIDTVVENIQKTLNRLNNEKERGDSMPKYDKAAYAEEMKARTAELTDKLQTGMGELYNSDKYKGYLKAMSQFHNYSSKNIMLIHQQMPDASRIASYTLWKEKFDRQVKKGETGLYIYAPMKPKAPETVLMEKLDPATGTPLFDKDGKPIMEEMSSVSSLRVNFILVPVFDVSQTYGDPLPELVENITGNVAHYEAFIDALREVSPLPIAYEPMDADQDGYCEFGVKIGIREGMSETQTVCAVVHEVVHDKLHDKSKLPENVAPKKARIKEIEAESIAYVVCQHYGIETSPNSFGYLAEHGSQAELKASIDTIRREASTLITAIDERFTAICQERGIDLTAKAPEQAATPPVQAEPSYSTESRTENIAGVDFEFQEVVPEAAEKKPVYAAADLETARTDVLKTLDTLFYTQHDRDGVIALLDRNATNSDISLYLSNTHSGKTVIKAEPEYSLSVVTTGEGIENTLTNRMTAWEDVAPVVRSLAVQWKAEQNLEAAKTSEASVSATQDKISFYTLNINSNSVPSYYDNHNDAVEAYLSAPPPTNGVDGRVLGFVIEGSGYLNFVQRDDGVDRIALDDVGMNSKSASPVLMDSLRDIKQKVEAAAFNHNERIQDSPALSVSQTEPDEPDVIMPDPSIGFSEMSLCGYTADDMLPLTTDRALELFDANHVIFMLYPENEAVMAFDREEIITFGNDGIFGIERVEWLNSQEYADLSAQHGEAALETEIVNGNPDTFSIYQLRDGEELRYHRFASLKQLEADNLAVDRDNYDLAYTAPLPPKETLEELYEKFNDGHPLDYTGRSISVSDVVVIGRGGETSAHYVDNFGFAEIPDFLAARSEPARSVPAADISDKTATAVQEQAKRESAKKKPSLLDTLNQYEQKSKQLYAGKAEQGKENHRKNNDVEV